MKEKSGQKNHPERVGRKEERTEELKKELEELMILPKEKAEALFKAKLNLEPMEEVKKDYPLLLGDPDFL